MARYLRNPLTAVWALLTLITFLAFWVGAGGEGQQVDLAVTALVLAIAILKSRLVFRHFMEVRHAPAWLRWSCDGWLVSFGVMVLALYAL
ncbi:MAG: cytochrome C oxidase subunit IV family protein [Myxococcales bacterium]|nr:cytochrome C oxidase subunit IV family protein [Myxococcales bacterium]